MPERADTPIAAIRERPLVYACNDAWLYGILSLPAAPATLGVVIVVGGPQYRAGSHRQFTLLARELAAAGFPALRFDYRGMGDSEGDVRGFEHAGEDLRTTIDRFQAEVPGLSRVVLWGLCDGATAAALYAPDDARVAGVVLLNPWMRTEQGAARTIVRHYYGRRMLDPALWNKIKQGRFHWRAALAGLGKTLAAALRRTPPAQEQAMLPERLRAALARFEGKVLVQLSEADFTAREFQDISAASGSWTQLLAAPRFTRQYLERADHTLSRRAWHDQATQGLRGWLATF